MADWTPQSRAEEILFDTINGEPYDGLPQSRIEELLLELKDAIESGGGGGGGAYTTTVLFTNGASGDTTFQLSSAYTNFDAIAIYYSHFDGQDQYEDVRIYPTTFLNSVSSTDEVLGFANDVWYYYFSVYSTTEFRYVKSNAGYITDIIGIKYGSNSGGGGSSDYEEDILYNATPSTAAPSTLTLSHDYTDYDVLVFNLWRNADGYMHKYDRFLLVSDLNTNDRFQLITYTEYATYTVTDETTFTQINLDRMYIEKVVGIKFGGGSVDIEGRVDDTQAMIAPLFDTNTAYSIGKRVTYNNRLYQFTSAHAIGAWDSSEVTEVNVADAVGIMLTDTLMAGSTSITFYNTSITANSIIVPYASVWGVTPSNIVVSAGTCVLTFEAAETDMLVGIQIR